jgi:hypothetical protein
MAFSSFVSSEHDFDLFCFFLTLGACHLLLLSLVFDMASIKVNSDGEEDTRIFGGDRVVGTQSGNSSPS